MNFLRSNLLSFACLGTMFALGAYLYPGLPETLPMEYSPDGIPHSYLPKQAVILILPIAYAVSIVVINLMIRFSPDKFSMPNSQRPMDIIVFAVGILLMAIHLGILVAEGDANLVQQYVSIGLALFLLLTGNVVGKTERNFIIGIRTPWAIASNENWRATHRFGGRLMVITGVILFILSFYGPTFATNLTLGLSWIVVAAIYSFVFFLKNERNDPNNEAGN